MTTPSPTDDLNAVLTELNADLATLNTTISNAQSDVAALNTQIATLTSQLSAATANQVDPNLVANVKAAADTLTSTINTAASQVPAPVTTTPPADGSGDGSTTPPATS
jgi:hypothetical protein